MHNRYDEIEKTLAEKFSKIDEVAYRCTDRVLAAMKEENLSDRHFHWHTGYGYDDDGRRVLESIYARVFFAEEALVRTQIVSGTHALSICLRALTNRGDSVFCPTGLPYETILSTIGTVGNSPLSLKANGVDFDYIDLNEEDRMNIDLMLERLPENCKMIYIQRSGGYSFRRAISIDEIAELCKRVKAVRPELIVMVDNCYGEFVEDREPSLVGADIVAGSLIKNPGGGLALSGGYIVGKKSLVRLCADHLTAPGLGKNLGLSFGSVRSILQGLFLAPGVVASAVKGAIFAAKLFERAGYKVCPSAEEERSDIIQSIELGTEEKLLEFCKYIQAKSPVDSNVVPVPAPMTGYKSDVIMAAGAFVQGSSIELSADAPLKEPFAVYLQGGLNYYHAKIAVISAYEAIINLQ